MARVTIEDCIEQVPNRFQLVQMAAIRAKQLKKGANPVLPSYDNKAVVVALREIAAGLVAPDLDGPDLDQEALALAGVLDEAMVEPEPVVDPSAASDGDEEAGPSSE